jgi:hypothetical protein
MRALILIAGAALALAGCKNNDQHDNTMNVDENLTAENIVSNDVTAIDAVTGDAANMAADVDTNYGSLDNSAPESNGVARPSKPAPKTSVENAAGAAPQPQANAVTNSQ